jgi:hypothetical protein
MNMMEKFWRVDTPPLKKLLAKTITYRLYRKLNKGSFEVVYESNLDPSNPDSEKPDVVVYSKKKYFMPVVAIEICNAKEIRETILEAGKMLTTYKLEEFFIFDYESDNWFFINEQGDKKLNSFSNYFSIDFNSLVELFPKKST